jgi:hypothetical protein
MGMLFFAWRSCLIHSKRIGVLGTMTTKPVPKPRRNPAPKQSQPVLPLESAVHCQRIPEAARAKCVQLFRELLEVVVLRTTPNHGGIRER